MTKKKGPTRALTFQYSGIAKRELEASRAVAARVGVLQHTTVRLPDLEEAGDIAGFDPGTMPPTYIPGRNAIFYSIAASQAEIMGADRIVGGHNKDDSEVFEDVGSVFFRALEGALREGYPALREGRLRIVRPFKDMRKAEVVKLAVKLGIPLELTWSCHKDGRSHCWRCEGCLSRTEAFHQAGLKDPLR